MALPQHSKSRGDNNIETSSNEAYGKVKREEVMDEVCYEMIPITTRQRPNEASYEVPIPSRSLRPPSSTSPPLPPTSPPRSPPLTSQPPPPPK